MVEFSFERVFERAWEEFKRGLLSYLLLFLIAMIAFGVVFVIGLVVFLPVLFSESAAPDSTGLISGVVGGTLLVLGLAAAMLLGSFIQLMVLEVTSQLFGGYQPDLGVAFQWAKQRFWPFLGLTVLLFLGLAAGYVLLIIPGVLLYLLWVVAPYVYVKEGVGPFDALSRSRILTGRAYGWTFLVIGLFTFIAVIVSVFQFVPIVGWIVSFFGSLLLNMYAMPLHGALYEELRRIEEGTQSVQPGPVPPAAQPEPVPVVAEPTVSEPVVQPVVALSSPPKKAPPKKKSVAAKKPATKKVSQK